MLKLLVVLLSLLAGCTDGKLDDARDRYLSVFGVRFTQPATHKGGLLARVVNADESPAAWAQVYARPIATGPGSNPVIAMTNEKGGFYLGNLEPGSYQIFVTSPAGQGVGLRAEVKEGEVIENERLALSSVARIYGHVTLENEPANTGVMVYVPGTPFSAFSDQEGSYYIDLPQGDYQVRAERDTFTPFESPMLQIDGDTELNILLKPNPWPNGLVKIVNSDDGFVVRGLKTKLAIKVEAGVRHMRITSSETSRPVQENGKPTEWIPVRSELDLSYRAVGYRRLVVEFRDAYGKKSDPLYVSFYNTTLDRSWAILHGNIKRPVVIKTGQKVFFLGYEDLTIPDASGDIGQLPSQPNDAGHIPDDSVEGHTQDNEGDSTDPIIIGEDGSTGGVETRSRETISLSSAVRLSSSLSTNFEKTVTIEAGAKLLGGAIFSGPLIVNGTAAAPVTWSHNSDNYRSSISLRGESAILKHVKINKVSINAALDSGPILSSDDLPAPTSNVTQSLSFDRVDMTEVYFGVCLDHLGGLTKAAMILTIDRSKLEDVYLDYVCALYSSEAESTTSNGEGSQLLGVPPLVFDIRNSTLTKTRISLDYFEEQQRGKARLVMDHNNFLDVLPGDYYFAAYGYSGQRPEAPTPSFPDASQFDYVMGENHFREPSRLFPGVDANAWPAFMGINRPQPWDLSAR